jgi:hypothetical protein
MGPLDRLVVLLESIEQVFCSAGTLHQEEFCQKVRQLRVLIESKIGTVSELSPVQKETYAQLKKEAMKLLKGV